MTPQAEQNWLLWREQTMEDPDLAAELAAVCKDDAALEDRFYKDLEFGTGGLRGVIGAGTNRMNIYTVAKATQGYADYLKERHEAPSVAIAYDSRIKSDVFARTTGQVFAANGIAVYMYSELMPTPALSFAVRHLGCSGGVVITASHNPAKYNGYKVYGSDGCQITTKAAKEIFERISQVDTFGGVAKMDFDLALEQGRIHFISAETIDAYLAAVSAESLGEKTESEKELRRKMPIVYTPLNGTGRYCVTRILKENGFDRVIVVPEQEMPDSNFPTCPYPNPEVREAMELGISLAQRTESELVLATDPDCDRVGIAVKQGREFVLLSGNEVGILLLDYICKRRIAMGRMPDRPVAVKTIVTIDMAKKIAAQYGIELREVLTGFKYIGEQIGMLEKAGQSERFIFGFEESYGYLSGSYVRDKDGVNASLLICEMTVYYKARGLTLQDALNQLYETYGYCLNTQHTYAFEGVAGAARMREIMDAFRSEPPRDFAGLRVEKISDYKTSVARTADGREVKIALPASNVLKFWLEGDSSVVVRPSGTEPKLKVYLSVSAKTREKAKAWEEKIREELNRRKREIRDFARQ